jgi:hypothetical protein
LPSESNDLLMLAPSFSLCPVASVCLTLSEPARSTSVSVARKALDCVDLVVKDELLIVAPSVTLLLLLGAGCCSSVPFLGWLSTTSLRAAYEVSSNEWMGKMLQWIHV